MNGHSAGCLSKRAGQTGACCADEVGEALPGFADRGRVEQAPLPVIKRQAKSGIGEGETRDGGQDVAELGCLRAEKLAASRYVAEEVPDRNPGAARPRLRFDGADPSQLHLDSGSLAINRGGLDEQARHGRNRGQGLASKTQSGQAFKVGCRSQLGRGVPFEGQQSIVMVHAGTVVLDVDEITTARSEANVNTGGPGIDGVLNQLLDHRGRSLNHLPGRNLVDESIGQ